VTVPILIITRDRVTYLKNLVEWLESIGKGERIHLVDNESTYPPLLEYLENTPHTVHHGENHGPTLPWRIPALEGLMANEYFVVTDYDIYPAEGCPEDIIERSHHVLTLRPGLNKVGPCLQIDDLPPELPRTKAILKWETPLWGSFDPEVGCYRAAIDTTFALCRPWTPYTIEKSWRLGRPYMFRHLPWYLDYDNLNEEDQYFSDHAHSASTWGRQELPQHLQELL
jgi:hypothetical protein